MLNPNVRHIPGPSRFFYVIGALVIVAGFVVGVRAFVKDISTVGTWLTRVTVPGTGEMTLAEPGKYTVYHEHQSVVDGTPHSSHGASPGALEYVLRNKATGTEVPLTVPSSDETYNFGARSGVAVMVFTISEPGDYELSASYREGHEGPEMVLAIGKGVLKRLAAAILTLLGAVGGGIVIGVAIIVVTALMRGKAKRALQAYPPQTMAPPGQGVGL